MEELNLKKLKTQTLVGGFKNAVGLIRNQIREIKKRFD